MCKLESRVLCGLEAVRAAGTFFLGWVGSTETPVHRAAGGAYLAGSDVTWPGRSPERAGPGEVTLGTWRASSRGAGAQAFPSSRAP